MQKINLRHTFNRIKRLEKRRSLFFLVTALIALPLLVLGAQSTVRFLSKAVGENSSLRLPSSASVVLNSEVSIPVNLSTGGVNVRGVDVVMQFDPTRVSLVRVTPTAKDNGIFKTFAPLDTSGNFNMTQVVNIAATSGRIEFSALAFDNSQGIINSPYNGSTQLASLVFRGLQLGSSTVSFVFSPSSTTDTNIVMDGTTPSEILNLSSQVTNLTLNVTNPPTNTPTPTPVPSSGSLLEAENAQLVNTAVESEYAGFTGSGYANLLSATGSSITWNNVNATSTGYYNLIFRYSLGASDRRVELRVNGSVVQSSLNFVTTGVWSTYRELSVPVQLNGGTNTVKLTTIGSEGPNVDSLRTSQVTNTPTPTRTPTGVPTQSPTSTPALPTPTPPPSSGSTVVLNSATGKTCTTICSNLGKTCSSVGLDSQATDKSAWGYSSTNGCSKPTTITCAYVMGNRGAVCSGHQANWTQCKCI